MRLLFVVDGRSPIALNWISYFTGGEHEVHLASTFPFDPPEGIASFHVTPVAFSAAKKPSPLSPSLHSGQAPLPRAEGKSLLERAYCGVRGWWAFALRSGSGWVR